MFTGELGKYFQYSWDRYQQSRKTRAVYHRLGKIHEQLPEIPFPQERGVSYLGVDWGNFPTSLIRFTEDGFVFLNSGSRCTVVSAQADSMRTLQLIMYVSSQESDDSRASILLVSSPDKFSMWNNRKKLAMVDGSITLEPSLYYDKEDSRKSLLAVGAAIVRSTQSLIEGSVRGAQRYGATQWR